MTTLCYYNFNSKNASNNIENVIFGVYDLSLNGTLTNISISSTYTKFGFPSLYRSVSDSASRSYYYNALSLLNTSFSIAFWLRTTGGSNAECALRLDNGTNYILFYLSNGSANSNFIQIQVPGDNTWYGMFLKTTGLSAGKIWNTNDWNHIALIASYNGTTTSINVYYNGSLVNYEFATVGGGLNTSTNKVTPPANATDSVKVTGQVFSSVPTLYILGSPINNGLACYVSNIYLINYAISTTELNNIINNVYIPKFNSYLRGKFDNTYAVTSQVLSAQTYSPNCVSSDGKNLISLQGTYPNFTIYYSTNYGANWALSNAPVTIYSPTCSPVNFPNVFYVGAINGSFKLYRSADGGATWTLISTQFGNISGLCVNDADTILYLSNYQNAMYYSTRAGNASFNYATNTGTFTFTQITNSNNSFQYTSCVCSPDGTFLFGTASGSNCAFKYNFNNTSSFNATLASSYNTNISGVAMSSTGSHLYASLFSNASNSLLRSTDGGATFNAIGTGVIPNNSNFGISCDTTGQYVQATTTTTITNILIPDGLVNYYPFDLGTTPANYATGSPVNDITVFNGAAVVNTKFKVGTGSIYFNGSSQYANISSLNFTTNGLSIVCWFNFTSGGWSRLFDFGNGAASDNILYCPGNGLSLYQGGGAFTQPGGGGYADGNWHHFAWTLTYAPVGSATSTWKLYIDGTVVYTSTTAGYPKIITRTNNYIAYSNWGSDGYSTGYVDDFRIYNRVLLESEITQLRANTNSTITTNSQLYWYISSNYGTTFTAYTGSLPSPPSIYNNNQFVLQLSNTNVNYITPPPYPCFLQGSKILRLNTETDEESYVPVETLREGDLIRTHQNGYKAIFHIGRKTLDRPSDDPNPRNRLYRFPKSKIPGMREDLCITGEHCTLHTDLSPEMKDKVNEHMGDIYITEYMYRVPACLDERAVPYKGDGPVTIWHFALENHNIYHNYGVYANGLLVESCSIQYLTELANMELR